LSNPLNILKT